MPAANYQRQTSPQRRYINPILLPRSIYLTAHLLWPLLLRRSLSSLESGIQFYLLGMWNTRSLAHELSILYGSPDELLQNECGCWTNSRCCRHKCRWSWRYRWSWLHSQRPSPTGMPFLAFSPLLRPAPQQCSLYQYLDPDSWNELAPDFQFLK